MTPQTSKAVRISQHGGPEELQLVDVTVGEPGLGEIRIRHKAVGRRDRASERLSANRTRRDARRASPR